MSTDYPTSHNDPQPRFWNPSGAELSLTPDGFLWNPLDDFQQHINPDIVQLSEVRDRDCLVLLGEPGAGKSTELRREYEFARDDVSSGTALFFNLAEYTSEDAIVRSIFGTPAWQSWREGAELSLFLDSYDECRLSLINVANVLVRELRSLGSRERLKLRVASRSGVWPTLLRQQFEDLWESSPAIYELTPLRWKDAERLVQVAAIEDVDKFFQAARDVDATPMLSSPLSLQMLIDVWLRAGNLPTRRSELFYQSCLALCTEQNLSRDAAGHRGNLDPGQRVIVAARLAALTMICGRTGIWLGHEHGVPEESALLNIGQVSGGIERLDDADFAVNDDAIRDVVGDTRLFTSQGENAFVWRHRTYSEFLAAHYLTVHEVPIEQIRSMLCHADVQNIVPQLRGVAAWLGARREVLDFIRVTDAELLLNVDLTMHDTATRAAAVDDLLAAARRGELADFGLSPVGYRRLDHPDIADQVRPVILDRGRVWTERRLAIDIAQECCVDAIVSELLTLATDNAEDLHHRTNALRALRRSTSTDIQAPIRRMLDGGLPEDTDDDLRGVCLEILWPVALSTSELVNYIVPAKRLSYFGAYAGFLEYRFVERLSDEDLPIVLDWLESFPRPSLRRDTLWCSTLRDQILVRAWRATESEEVYSRLGSAFWPKLLTNHGWDSRVKDDVQQLADNADNRHRLVLALSSALPGVSHPAREIAACIPQIVREEDIQWLIEQLAGESDSDLRKIWADLLAGFIYRTSTSMFDLILFESECHSELREAISFAVAPIRLDSPEAARMREHYREEMKRENTRAARETHILTLSEIILRTLSECEAGRFERWLQLADALTLTDSPRRYGETRCSRITIQPGWENADVTTQNRIAACAESYLFNENPRADAWFDDPNKSGGSYAIAGVKALHLLRDTSTVTFNAIEDSVWETWLLALFDFHPIGTDEETRKMEMLAEACQRLPDVFLDNLIRTLDRENRRRSSGEEIREDGERVPFEWELPTRLPRQLEACWNPDLAAILRTFASDTANATVRGNIVEELVRHQDEETLRSITEMLSGALPSDEVDRMRARSDASSLILHAPNSALPLLSRLADLEPEFCRNVIQSWVSLRSFVDEEANACLNNHVLAGFYVLLRRLFPPEEDKRIDGAHAMTQREMVERKRDSILSHLVSRDSFEAAREIQAIAEAFPDNMTLRLTCLEAQRRALQADWTPLQPADVRSMIADSEKRVIRSGQELMQLLMESMARYDAELQGETPQNFTLWDKQQPRKVTPADDKSSVFFRPKEEERLSDALRQHFERDLRDRGIVTNREVEIRPRQGTGGDAGERTDIHVVAVAPQHNGIERVRIIVEVKGCWNREVNSAIRTQLRDRYLRDNDCTHGLYVVGWYICGQWDIQDGRCDEAQRQMPDTLPEARERFADQAEAESNLQATLAAFVLNCALR